MTGTGRLVPQLLKGRFLPWALPGCRLRTWRCPGFGRSCAASRGFCGMCRSAKSWLQSGVLVRMMLTVVPPLGALLSPCCSRCGLHSQFCLLW